MRSSETWRWHVLAERYDQGPSPPMAHREDLVSFAADALEDHSFTTNFPGGEVL